MISSLKQICERLGEHLSEPDDTADFETLARSFNAHRCMLAALLWATGDEAPLIKSSEEPSIRSWKISLLQSGVIESIVADTAAEAALDFVMRHGSMLEEK